MHAALCIRQIDRHPWHDPAGRLIETTCLRDNGALGLGHGCALLVLIAHDSSEVVGIGGFDARGNMSAAHPVVTRFGVGLDDDVVALAIVDEDAVGGEGDDGDEIRSDNGHLVAVDAPLVPCLGRQIDKSHAVLLAGFEDDFEFLAGANACWIGLVAGSRVHTVDESSGKSLFCRAEVGHRCPVLPCSPVFPIGEEDGAEIFIVLGCSRAVDHQGTEEAVDVLQTEVAVVHGGAVLGSVELVRHGLSRRNRALSDTGHAIEFSAHVLADTVPVDGGAVGGVVVSNVDDYLITPVGDDGRTWHGAVGENAFPLVAIRCTVDFLDVEPVLACTTRVEDGVVPIGVDVVVSPALA